jgi:hypothetical protein
VFTSNCGKVALSWHGGFGLRLCCFDLLLLAESCYALQQPVGLVLLSVFGVALGGRLWVGCGVCRM